MILAAVLAARSLAGACGTRIGRRWLGLHEFRVRPRPAELAPLFFVRRAERRDVHQAVHFADEDRVKNLVLGIRMHVEVDPPVEPGRFLKWFVTESVSLKSLPSASCMRPVAR